MFPRKAHESWRSCPAFDLVAGIAKQLVPGTFCPQDAPSVFNAFSMPVDDVKVIIVGKSPYPQKENACGYAFAIPQADRKYDQWPASLKVLTDALVNTYGIEFVGPPNAYIDPTLSEWRSQGVLLLNAALTCIERDPSSHEVLWQPFTTQLFTWLNETRSGLIWWFMGDDAKSFSHLVFDLAHHKFFSQHPARAARNNERMTDVKFKEVGQVYKSLYGEELTWILPF